MAFYNRDVDRGFYQGQIRQVGSDEKARQGIPQYVALPGEMIDGLARRLGAELAESWEPGCVALLCAGQTRFARLKEEE